MFLSEHQLKEAFISLTLKEEQYEHLEEAEIQKVDKMVSEVMMWMNSKMNQQSKQNLTADPVVKAAEITAKTRVSFKQQSRFMFILNVHVSLTFLVSFSHKSFFFFFNHN